MLLKGENLRALQHGNEGASLFFKFLGPNPVMIDLGRLITRKSIFTNLNKVNLCL